MRVRVIIVMTEDLAVTEIVVLVRIEIAVLVMTVVQILTEMAASRAEDSHFDMSIS